MTDDFFFKKDVVNVLWISGREFTKSLTLGFRVYDFKSSHFRFYKRLPEMIITITSKCGFTTSYKVTQNLTLNNDFLWTVFENFYFSIVFSFFSYQK